METLYSHEDSKIPVVTEVLYLETNYMLSLNLL
jgi:hypothetical protein